MHFFVLVIFFFSVRKSSKMVKTCPKIVKIQFVLPLVAKIPFAVVATYSKTRCNFFPVFDRLWPIFKFDKNQPPPLPPSTTTLHVTFCWTLIVLYFSQFNSDLYETLFLRSCDEHQQSQLVILQFGVTPPCLSGAIFVSSLYLCQFNLDLYETLNLSSCPTNQ